jgi:Uma2 family endonuclease
MADHPASTIAREFAFPISVDMYHQMIENGILVEGDRVELIEGVIVAVSPQSPEHARAISSLQKLLRALGPEWAVRVQLPMSMPKSEPEPDVLVCRQEVEDRAERHPTTASLVIEVARDSLEMDRALAELYARAEVTEYWVVNVAAQEVEAFRDPRDGSYRTSSIASIGETLRPVALDGLEISVSAIFRASRH